jgi:diguanylate cyclase (GGDEF)-like protein
MLPRPIARPPAPRGGPNSSPRTRHLRSSSQVLRPLALTAAADALLFACIDVWDWASLLRASLGVALLFAVALQQIMAICALEAEVRERERQMEVVRDVVFALNAPAGSASLPLVLEQIRAGLDADGVLLCVPDAASADGNAASWTGTLPARATVDSIRAAIQGSTPKGFDGDACRSFTFSGVSPDHRAGCLLSSLGRRSDDQGWLAALRFEGAFDGSDASLLATVAHNVGGALRGLRLLREARSRADRDPVTGLLNQRSAYERLGEALERAAETELPVSVLMLDLDNFKAYNDAYGHPAGDGLLRRVGRVLQACSRDSDAACRYGGDEFVVLLPETSREQALRYRNRLEAALREEFARLPAIPAPGDGSAVRVGCSLGIATSPADGIDPIRLVEAADDRMYAEKRAKPDRRLRDTRLGEGVKC